MPGVDSFIVRYSTLDGMGRYSMEKCTRFLKRYREGQDGLGMIHVVYKPELTFSDVSIFPSRIGLMSLSPPSMPIGLTKLLLIFYQNSFYGTDIKSYLINDMMVGGRSSGPLAA